MIEFINQNILESDETIILHGCNCQGIMGAGIALQIKSNFPNVYQEYKKEYDKNGLMLGSVQYVSCNEKLFINAMTQKNIGRGRQVSYDAIEQCLITVNEDLKGNTISMPKIGCGLGGGNWNIIEKIIEETLPDMKVKIYYV